MANAFELSGTRGAEAPLSKEAHTLDDILRVRDRVLNKIDEFGVIDDQSTQDSYATVENSARSFYANMLVVLIEAKIEMEKNKDLSWEGYVSRQAKLLEEQMTSATLDAKKYYREGYGLKANRKVICTSIRLYDERC